MKKIKDLIAKVRSVKNIELILAGVLAVVVVIAIIISANFSTQNVTKNTDDESYITQMEHKIVSVIEKIDGCGKVTVAISHDSYEEKVSAYETVTNSSGDTVKQTTSIVSVKGEPLVVKTLPPNVLGVVVVAEGADNPIVKMKITEVVVTLLDVDVSKVQVFTYKS